MADAEPAATCKQPDSTSTILAVVTAGLLLVLYALVNLSQYTEISRNWALYRCDPGIMPFAAYYGHDLEEAIGFCLGEGVRKHAPAVINPIYAGIGKVNGVIDGVFNKVTAIQNGVNGLLDGLQSFIINFVNSFRLLGTRVRMIFVGMRDIFARIYGMFVAVVYAGISAITFGENLVCNPLVTFIATISGSPGICCFAPDTPIRMADGRVVPIRAVEIGDQLMGSQVTSTYVFDGAMIPMVRIGDIHVSTNHYVEHEGRMILAGAHPAAVAAPSLDRIWCLGTDTHRIPLVGLTVADYEESSDPAVIAAAQEAAETLLTGSYGSTVADYSLGLDPTLRVMMKNLTSKPLSAVQIGDELLGGGVVTGTVSEICESQYISQGGHYVSGAQLVLLGGRWIRAANAGWPAVAVTNETLIHLFVTTNMFTVGGEDESFIVRDYAEVNSDKVQAPYTRAITR